MKIQNNEIFLFKFLFDELGLERAVQKLFSFLLHTLRAQALL
jgi:hypothetical protein